MRRFFGILLFVGFFGLSLSGQQEERYTQFMLNKLSINPGCAGSSEGISISSLVRSQWIGFEGAPETQLVSFSMPLWNDNLGLGANIVRQTIGVSSNYALETAYSYRIRAPRGYVHLGLQASARMIRTDFTRLQGTQPVDIDQAVPANIQSKLVPNFGAGIYYDAENFYFGLSVPRLLQSNIDLSDDEGVIAREVLHLYLMTGFLLRINDNMSLQPQALFRYVKSAPLEADINLNLLLMEKFSAGVSYRPGGARSGSLGESLAFLVGLQLSEKLLFGISYDVTLSELKSYTDGTVEGVLRFMFAGKSSGGGKDVDSPRYFF